MNQPTSEPATTAEYADADGDTLRLGIPAFPASGGPCVSIYTPEEPFHLAVEQVPAVIADLRRLAAAASGGSTTAPEQPEPAAPAVGDRYTHRPGFGDRTVTRVWTPADGRTSVAYEWDSGQAGSACPLDVFHRVYEPVTPAEPTVTPLLLSEAEREFLTYALNMAADDMASRITAPEAAESAALASLRKLAGGEPA